MIAFCNELWLNQARRHGGGHFGSVPTQITSCDPQARSVPSQARVVPRKKVTGPVPLEGISGPVSLQNIACAPESVGKISFQEEKHM